jgi:hypothetical protein
MLTRKHERPIVHLSTPPLDDRNYPQWNRELEEHLWRVLKDGDNFDIRFKLSNGLITGLAVALAYRGKPRLWNVRAVVLPSENNKLAASFHFSYDGEDRNLPDGGQKMYPRLPLEDRVIGIFDSNEAVQDALSENCSVIDEAAEQAYQEAKHGSSEFMRGLMTDLASGKVPSAEEIVDRMLKR